VVHAYFDESGSQAGSDYICLCGYIAEDENWQMFCQEWGKQLRLDDIPYVHVANLMSRMGVYKSKTWTDGERDDLLSRYINIIRSNALAGFAIGFDAKHFRTMPSQTRQDTGDAHMFCFIRMMRNIVETLRGWSYEPSISIVFDDHQRYSPLYYSRWSELRAKHPDMKKRIASITFADDEVFYPLQGADILCWLSNRHLHGMSKNAPVSRHLGEVLQDPVQGFAFRYVQEFWDKNELDDKLPKLCAAGRAKLKGNK
jgi:hypothetical protein